MPRVDLDQRHDRLDLGRVEARHAWPAADRSRWRRLDAGTDRGIVASTAIAPAGGPPALPNMRCGRTWSWVARKRGARPASRTETLGANIPALSPPPGAGRPGGRDALGWRAGDVRDRPGEGAGAARAGGGGRPNRAWRRGGVRPGEGHLRGPPAHQRAGLAVLLVEQNVFALSTLGSGVSGKQADSALQLTGPPPGQPATQAGLSGPLGPRKSCTFRRLRAENRLIGRFTRTSRSRSWCWPSRWASWPGSGSSRGASARSHPRRWIGRTVDAVIASWRRRTAQAGDPAPRPRSGVARAPPRATGPRSRAAHRPRGRAETASPTSSRSAMAARSLVQVPAGPPPSLPGMPASSEPIAGPAPGRGPPLLPGGGPHQQPDRARAVRRRRHRGGGPAPDGLAASLARLPAPCRGGLPGRRPGARGEPRDLPATGWTPRWRDPTVAGEPWPLRRLDFPAEASPDGGLWVALPVREFARAERRLLFEFLALLAGGMVVLAGVVLAFLPSAGRARPVAGAARGEPANRARTAQPRARGAEAIATTIGRGADWDHRPRDPRGGRGLAGMDVGSANQLEPPGATIMVAGSGFDPRHVERRRSPGRRLAHRRRGAHQPDPGTHLDAVPRRRKGSARWRRSGRTAPSSRCRSRWRSDVGRDGPGLPRDARF